MKAILTITSGNKDPKNFTRVLNITIDDLDYLEKCARIINQGGNNFISVHVLQL